MASVPSGGVGLTEESPAAVDLSAEMKDLSKAVRERPGKPPKIDFHAAPVNVTTPDVHVTTPPVNVSVPQPQAPDIHVHQPDIHINVPRSGGFDILRDKDGNVIGTKPKEN